MGSTLPMCYKWVRSDHPFDSRLPAGRGAGSASIVWSNDPHRVSSTILGIRERPETPVSSFAKRSSDQTKPMARCAGRCDPRTNRIMSAKLSRWHVVRANAFPRTNRIASAQRSQWQDVRADAFPRTNRIASAQRSQWQDVRADAFPRTNRIASANRGQWQVETPHAFPRTNRIECAKRGQWQDVTADGFPERTESSVPNAANGFPERTQPRAIRARELGSRVYVDSPLA